MGCTVLSGHIHTSYFPILHGLKSIVGLYTQQSNPVGCIPAALGATTKCQYGDITPLPPNLENLCYIRILQSLCIYFVY